MSENRTTEVDPDRTATLEKSGHRSRAVLESGLGSHIIGRYRLQQKLGEGGMGEVWEAEQTEPVHRQVALKLIKRGMDSAQVVARFESERQALALMEHSAIAKVFDAGTTEHGRPYFVMELVHGAPIHEYCDRHRLSVPQRLELLVQVCEGIQHAHQKAIIHRDVKPSNILVTEQDGAPVPKIIDFGVAKATRGRLADDMLATQVGQLLGTPEYMSPEQLGLEDDIDTRTDVYSLGLVLYELLVGTGPFDTGEHEKCDLLEIRRRIREEEPVRPSTRISDLGTDSTPLARLRNTDPASLRRQLQGDLEWIVMKALRRNRSQRYTTAAELSTDIRRFLRHEPIIARPPNAAYRVRKFLRRHRLGVAAAGVALLAIIAGSVGLSVGLVRAVKAERQASEEARSAQQVADFLVDLFEVSDPGEARGNTITAREVLDAGAAKVEDELGDQPRIQARLMYTISKVFTNLGLYEDATRLGQNALERREEVFGPDDPKVAESLFGLADAELLLGRYAEAETHLYRALAIRQELLGGDHSEVAEIHHGLALLHFYRGDYGEAGTLLRRALDIWEGTLEPDDPALAGGFNDLATILYTEGKYEESAVLFQRALELWQESLGEDHPYVATALNNIGAAYKSLGDYAQAEPHYRRALELWERTLGPDHPEVASSLNNLGSLYRRTGRTEEAIEHYTRATEIWEQGLGPDHPDVAISLGNLAGLYKNEGRLVEAEPLFDRALAIRRQALGTDHADFFLSLRNLGDLYRRQGRFDAAEGLLRQALEGEERTLGPEHPNLADGLHSLALLCAEQGRYADGEKLFLRALPIAAAALGSEHPDFLTLRTDYAALLETMGRPGEAAHLESGDTSSWTTQQPPP